MTHVSFLPFLAYILLLANVLILLYLIYYNRDYFRKFFLKLKSINWLLLLGVFLFSLTLNLYLAPHEHKMYLDEFKYLEVGKQIVTQGHAEPYKSYGYPFIVAVLFGIFGMSNTVILYATSVFSALSVVGIYLIAYSLSRRVYLSVIPAVLLSLFPMFIAWSGTAETNITALFFVIVAVFFSLHAFQKRKLSLLWLSIFSLAFAAQMRVEYYILLPVFLFAYFLFHGVSQIKKLIVPIFMSLLILIPNGFMIIDFYDRNWIEIQTDSTETGDNFSIGNLWNNSVKYGARIFNDRYQPWYLLPFVIIGFFHLFNIKPKVSAFFLLWFLSLWVIYFSFAFQVMGGKTRFYSSFYPLLSLYAFYGFLFIFDKLNKLSRDRLVKRSIIFILVISLIISFVPYTVTARISNPNYYLQSMLPKFLSRDVPAECTIIAVKPVVLITAKDLNVISIKEFLNDSSDIDSCTIFLEDFMCKIDKIYKQRCNEVKLMDLSVFAVYEMEGIEYKLHRVKSKVKE